MKNPNAIPKPEGNPDSAVIGLCLLGFIVGTFGAVQVINEVEPLWREMSQSYIPGDIKVEYALKVAFASGGMAVLGIAAVLFGLALVAQKIGAAK